MAEHPPTADAPAAKQIVASVVIPSYNGSEYITDCVGALLSQQTDFPFEVIVVDSSSDGSDEMLRTRCPGARLIHFDVQTSAPRQRNVGIQNARGEIIGLMDQDCIADPGWLQGMVDAHREHPEAIAVAGGIRPANPERVIGLANFHLEFREFNHVRPREMTDNWITCNVSVKRELFERYGEFPEDLWPGDDVVVAQAGTAAGEKVLFAPELSIAHVNRGDLKRILPHARKLGWASAQIRKRLPTVPHAWMVRYPVSALTIPVARPLRVLWSYLKWQPLAAMKMLWLVPLMSLICMWWAVGFIEGARE